MSATAEPIHPARTHPDDSTHAAAVDPALIQRLRVAQAEWSTLPVQQRLLPVRRFRHVLVERRAELCAAVAEDIAKPAAETLPAELLPLAEACLFLERRASRLLRPRRVSWWDTPLWLLPQTDEVHRRPRGIVGIIGTWNYPLLLNGVQIVQALTAGNAVLWKPSEVAPHAAEALWSCLQSCGYPADLLARLPATRDMGPALADADLDHVVFTGHDATGRRLAAHLGQRLISSTLELSGCDALIALADADVDLAARAAWFGFSLNAGQTCIAVRRAFVARSVYDAFLKQLEQLGCAAAPRRLATPGQSRQANQLVAQAVRQGARLLLGGAQAEAAEYQPTILVNVRSEHEICRVASFAPVLAVLPFDDLAAVVDAQRLCPYALAASIFTRDLRAARKLAAQLRVGAVCINDVVAPTAHPATPFGGRGASGWGVTQGVEGFLEMTVPQVISQRPGRFRPHFDPPGGTSLNQPARLDGFFVWQHGRTWRQRWQGFWRMCRGK